MRNTPSRTAGKLALAAALLLALALSAVAVFAALPAPTVPLVPSGAISPAVWSPDANPNAKWETGNPDGYAEGDSAAITFHIDPDDLTTDTEYQVYLCLQIEDGSNSPYNYAFSAATAWDATLLPPTLPAANQSTAIATPPYTDPAWDTDNAVVYGYNVDIISVDGPERGTGNTTAPFNDCDTNYLGGLIKFSVPSGVDDAWITFGGRFASAGDPVPAGVPQTGDPVVSNVPDGRSASFINGTFQARIGGTGDKTINFQGNSTTAVTLADIGAAASSPALLPAALLLLGALASLAFARRRA